MSYIELSDFVGATAKKFQIPGVAVGIWSDGQEYLVCRGVTSIDNPLPVDPDTLFGLGSVSKTFTVTALMRLIAEVKVELGRQRVAMFRSSSSRTSRSRQRSPC